MDGFHLTKNQTKNGSQKWKIDKHRLFFYERLLLWSILIPDLFVVHHALDFVERVEEAFRGDGRSEKQDAEGVPAEHMPP